MGWAQNIVMLMVIISIVSDNVGVQAGFTTPSILSSVISGNGAQAANFLIYNILNDPTIGIFAISATLLGLFVFPNPYAIFGGLALSMLTTFIIMPYQMFSGIHGLPSPLNILVVDGFGLAIMFGVLNWFKGGTGEL